MLTQAMPSLARALNGSMQPNAVRDIMQSLGNCGQDVTQRAGMSVLPSMRRQSFGDNPAGWNPYETPNIGDGGWLPSNAEGSPFVEMPSGGNFRAGDWYSTNYGSPLYSFSTPILNNLTTLLGGPTNFIGGNTVFENITSLNPVNVVNEGDIFQTTTSGDQPAGPPGSDGSDGQDGADGFAGPPGGDGIVEFVPRLPIRRKGLMEDIRVRKFWLNVVTNAEFDAETCSITVSRAWIPGALVQAEPVRHQLRYFGPANGLGLPDNR